MKRIFSATLIACTTLTLAACGGGSSSGGGSSTQDISIPFAARANGTDISCGASLTGLGTDFATGTIRSFALFIHDVTLINSDGSELPVTLAENDWQTSGVALLDYQDKLDSCSSDTDKPTNTTLEGSVKGNLSNVTGIRFSIGVPSELNHNDATVAASPLNRSDMFWSWQFGYKHVRMDVAPDGGVLKPDNSTTTTWNIHLGDTGCVGDAQSGEIVECSANNRPVIELDLAGIDGQQVVIEYSKLVENSSLLTDQGGAPGCMSGPTDADCVELFDALGMGLGENSDPTEGQTVFSVETVDNSPK